LRILHFNAVDSRKVHARDAVQLPAKVKARLMPTRVLASAWFRYQFEPNPKTPKPSKR
jgi:hypothetical protein